MSTISVTWILTITVNSQYYKCPHTTSARYKESTAATIYYTSLAVITSFTSLHTHTPRMTRKKRACGNWHASCLPNITLPILNSMYCTQNIILVFSGYSNAHVCVLEDAYTNHYHHHQHHHHHHNFILQQEMLHLQYCSFSCRSWFTLKQNKTKQIRTKQNKKHDRAYSVMRTENNWEIGKESS